MFRFVAFLHGSYYFVTGLWPIVDINSFIAVTGPKYDIWLVKMVGLLTISISLLLFTTGIKKKLSAEGIILILASCISYMSIDIYYTLNGRIRPIYLADALAELMFLILWIVLIVNSKRQTN